MKEKTLYDAIKELRLEHNGWAFQLMPISTATNNYRRPDEPHPNQFDTEIEIYTEWLCDIVDYVKAWGIPPIETQFHHPNEGSIEIEEVEVKAKERCITFSVGEF